MSEYLLSPDEVSEQLQVPIETLRRWRYERRGPTFVRVGKAIRYRQSDVDVWLARMTVESSSPNIR
jgi:excisionase family DNA binding protein